MALISIKSIVDRAKARGFRVVGGEHYAEIFAPDHEGPEAIWHSGCQYSCCDFVIGDRPSSGYGYNCCFYGPWHDGMVQSTSHGVAKLLAHPLMQD